MTQSEASSDLDSGLDSTVRSDAAATRLRIVAAAERLFAERGIDGVSLQQINRAAGQRNRSAVQYHFGNKEGVIHAILDKHTAGIERRRHELLDEIEASGKLELRRLAEALVIPLAEKLDDPDGGIAFLRVNAQLIGHPDFPLLELHAQRVNRGAERLQRLTARACPDLPEELWMSRWLALSGLLFHGMADYAHLTERKGGAGLNIPRSVFVSNMVDCAVAVMEVPESPETDAEFERSRRPDEEPPMSEDVAGRFGLGPIDQVSYVVEDLDKALGHYEALFGPFKLGESPLTDCTIRGRRADCTLKLAVNNAGPVEIELIQVLEGDTPHSEHLRDHGEGIHHVRFRVKDLDAKLEQLGEAGFETVFYKRFGPTLGFAYVEVPREMGGSVIELLEMP